MQREYSWNLVRGIGGAAMVGLVAWLPILLWEWKPIDVRARSVPEVRPVAPANQELVTPDVAESIKFEPLPGGSLPVLLADTLPSAPMQTSEPDAAPSVAEDSDAPRPLPATNEATPLPRPDVEVSTLKKPAALRVAVGLPEPKPNSLRVQNTEPASVTVSSALPVAAEPDEASTIRLMHELAGDRAAVAERALRERGFADHHLELARRLTSSDIAIRAALARELLGVADIDPQLWLMWLLRDDAPSVRLAAINVLATTGDASTLRRLESIARQDPDPTIRQHAEKLRRR